MAKHLKCFVKTAGQREIQTNRLNEKIYAKEVRLIGQSGENLGIKPIQEALNTAREADMDLVEVSKGSTPPVCRIMDFNKYAYELKTRQKKTKSKKSELKEFQLSPTTAEGDLNMRIARGKEFLAQGNMVKYTVKFKGRENKYPQQGEIKLKIIESELSGVAKIDRPAKKIGSTLSVTFVPRKE